MLALLAGLVAMHGLAGGHATHAMRAGAPAVMDTAAAPEPVAAAVALEAAAMPGHGLPAAGLCLAVLAAAFGLALAARRRITVGMNTVSRTPDLSRSARHRRAPPPDLVAGLCVSRT